MFPSAVGRLIPGDCLQLLAGIGMMVIGFGILRQTIRDIARHFGHLQQVRQPRTKRWQSRVLVGAACARVPARSQVSVAGRAVARASAHSARVRATPADPIAGPSRRVHPVLSSHGMRSNLWMVLRTKYPR